MTIEDTIFGKIIRGELPSTKVYEDDDFLVIQSLYQATPGHTLIIPKEYSKNIATLNPKLGNKLLALIQKIGAACVKGLDCDGYNVALNYPPVTGHVEHTHVHIIPVNKGQPDPWPEQETSKEDIVKYASKIISALED